jgi:hypothetical protein
MTGRSIVSARRRAAGPRGVAALAVAVLGTGALVAPAATAVPGTVSVPAFADRADVVVRGTVTGAGTSVPGTEGVQVDTLVPVRVERVFKGSAPSVVSVRVHGGTVGARTLTLSSEPSLSPGDHVDLYLTRGADGTFRPVDGLRGVFENVGDHDGPSGDASGNCSASDGSGFSGFNALRRWPGSSFTYVIGTSALTYQGEISAAANTWNGSGAAFTITNGGVDPTLTGGPVADGKNGITFAAYSSSLAVASTWSSGGVISEVDITYNTAYTWSAAPTTGQYDVQSVGVHELGHALGLGHVQDTAQTLYPCIGSGVLKRSLGWGDAAGVRNIYPPNTQGYYLLEKTGAVFGLGGANSGRGSAAPYYGGANQNNVINYPTNTAVAIEVRRPTRNGYWILASNGGVFSFGSAPFKGSAVGILCGTCKAVDIVSTPSGEGYWVLASDGGVFAFGDAGFHGSAVGMFPAGGYATGIAVRPDGSGYWILNNFGQTYTFDVPYIGGCYPTCAQPAASMHVTADGGGYWILAANGAIFAYGNAPHLGQAIGWGGPQSLTRHPLSNGYAFTAPNGDVAAYSLTWYGRGNTPTPFGAMASTDFPIAPRFTLTGPAAMTVKRGACSSASLSLSSNNTFRATVSLSTSGAPSGSSASTSPSSVFLNPSSSGGSTLTVCAGATQLAGFTVTVTGNGSNGTSASTQVPVTVQAV